MPFARCPTRSATVIGIVGSLVIATSITKWMSNYFDPSSNIIDLPAPVSDLPAPVSDLPALVAVPRSMEPVSTYADYLDMLRTNNTQCFPTEAPLDPTTRFYMGLSLMFALLSKVFDTAFDLGSTFSPVLDGFILKPFIAASVLGSVLGAGILCSTMENPIHSAWFMARMTIPALVQSIVSKFVDTLVQHLFGRNTTSTTAEQTENLPEHQSRQQKLVLLTTLALTRILLEFLLRYGEDMLQLPPSDHGDYHFLVFKLAAFCTVPVFEYFKTEPMRLSLTAATFVVLHDLIDWLNLCISESLRNPFTTLVIDILNVPNLRVAIITFVVILNLSIDAWAWFQQQTYYKGLEQLIDRVLQRCKVYLRSSLNEDSPILWGIAWGIALSFPILCLRSIMDPNSLFGSLVRQNVNIVHRMIAQSLDSLFEAQLNNTRGPNIQNLGPYLTARYLELLGFRRS